MSRIGRRWPELVAAAAAVAMLVHGPIAQLAHYHEFADARTLLGVPRALDVLSNAGFIAVGLWGLTALWPMGRDPAFASSWPGYLLFSLALVATAFGSGWYHLAPDDARLVWDRLPIALACAGLLAAVHGDTHGDRHPWAIIGVLAVLACASVWWWSFTASHGVGDLRPYLYLQAAPLVLIPGWQAVRGAPRQQRVAFGIAILLYALAKVFELADHAVFDTLGVVSGHTIKHLLATAAAAVIIGEAAGTARDRTAPPAPRSPAPAAS
jgi:hypothetical protein